jgi:hypothetical protein
LTSYFALIGVMLAGAGVAHVYPDFKRWRDRSRKRRRA